MLNVAIENGNTSPHKEFVKLRSCKVRKNGIMPPEKNMVNTIKIVIGVFQRTSLCAKKYAPSDVKNTLHGTLTSSKNAVFLYPVIMFGFLNTCLYASKLKPMGLHTGPTCRVNAIPSEIDEKNTYNIGYKARNVMMASNRILITSKLISPGVFFKYDLVIISSHLPQAGFVNTPAYRIGNNQQREIYNRVKQANRSRKTKIALLYTHSEHIVTNNIAYLINRR